VAEKEFVAMTVKVAINGFGRIGRLISARHHRVRA
jgi:glyceraldehyde-3-phosphate dehydrogenase/erythrose-4-phosphate dehydrogenase